MGWFDQNAPTPVSAAAAPIPGGNTIEQQAQVRQRPDPNQPMAQPQGTDASIGGTWRDPETGITYRYDFGMDPRSGIPISGPDGGPVPGAGGFQPSAPTGPAPDYSHLAQNPEEADFIQRIVQAQIAGYGGVRPGQVEYYLDHLRRSQATGETAPWLNDKPGLTMADYYEQRAMGMGAGGADTATQGQYAGQNFGSLAYQQAGGNPFAGPGDGGMMGAGLPPGYTIGDIYGGGKYPLSSFDAPGLAAPFTAAFQRPTVTDDPGYQFRMDEGRKALERSAAAKGTLLSGGTVKDMLNYAQGLASQEYQNAYGRDWNEYLTAYNIYDRNQANTFGRLNTLAGMGQNAAVQLGNFGSNYVRGAGDLVTGMGNVDAQNAINQGNIITGALPTVGTLIDSWRNHGGGTTAPPPTGTAAPFITSGPDRLGRGIEFG